MFSKFSSFWLTVLLVCGLCFVSGRGVRAVDETEAGQTVQQAQSALVSAYQAMLEAEKAGGNVSSLLVVLNQAGDLLSRAELALDQSDYDSASDFASKSQQTLSGFIDQATLMRDNAAQQNSADFKLTVLVSIMGTLAVIVVSLVLWVVLKRKYGKDGAVSNES